MRVQSTYFEFSFLNMHIKNEVNNENQSVRRTCGLIIFSFTVIPADSSTWPIVANILEYISIVKPTIFTSFYIYFILE